MKDILIQAVNLSISASYLVLAVLLLRPLLKKAPRWISVALWGLVGLRLVLPFSIESALSLLPSAQTIPPAITVTQNPGLQSGQSGVGEGLDVFVQYYPSTGTPSAAPAVTPGAITASVADPMQTWLTVAGILWVAGVVLMLGYTALSYLRLRWQVQTAVRLEGNIYQSERIDSAFVLGLLRPRIYLPTRVAAAEMPHVIAHERSHIARRDHWIKPLGFVLLSLYWFNPALWLAYVLLCRDIEMACDERVIRDLGADMRIDYSQALLSCSVSRRSIAACPLAFGEVSVKYRIKSILSYKNPGFWITVLSLVLCAGLAVSFLTDPVEAEKKEPEASQTQPTEAATAPFEPAEPDAAPTVDKRPLTEPVTPADAPFQPSPAAPVGIEMAVTWTNSGAKWHDDLDDCTYEEVAAYFGSPGVRLNNESNRYFWSVDGYSVFLYFGTQDGKLGSSLSICRRTPVNTEQVRRDFLDIAPGDIEKVTLTGHNTLGGIATLELPKELALEALATFQENARDAQFAGLKAGDFKSGYDTVQYLTLYTRDGGQTTVEFSTLLCIGEYCFAPTAQKQQAFHDGLYQRLSALLAQPLRQTVLRLQADQVELCIEPSKADEYTRAVDETALLNHLYDILGEFEWHDGRNWSWDEFSYRIQVALGGKTMDIEVWKDGYISIDGYVYKANTSPTWWTDLGALYYSQFLTE